MDPHTRTHKTQGIYVNTQTAWRSEQRSFPLQNERNLQF